MHRPAPVLLILLCLCPGIFAQDPVHKALEDAKKTSMEIRSAMRNCDVRPYWQEQPGCFFYRSNNASGGWTFHHVDTATGKNTPAFDHAAVAASLAKASGVQCEAEKLPILRIEPSGTKDCLRLFCHRTIWMLNTRDSTITSDSSPQRQLQLVSPEEAMRTRQPGGTPTWITLDNKTSGVIETFWVDANGTRKSFGKTAAGGQTTFETYATHVWLFADESGKPLAGAVASEIPSTATVTGKQQPVQPKDPDVSPDGSWRAAIRNHNLTITPASGGEPVNLTTDGTAKDQYHGPIQWSPDSQSVVAWHTSEVETRKVHIVQSSPPDQLQPKLLSFPYAKPGDSLPKHQPRIFRIATRSMLPASDSLFNNPWTVNEGAWSADSSEFSFLYNQRGHQVMRLVGINSRTGETRSILEEQSKTFIDYSNKTWLLRLPESHEILWMSERSGYNHIYRFDERSGKLLNPVTSGSINVREVVKVDKKNRTLILKINGITGQDPYHDHFARVGFDGTGFTRITDGDGNHKATFSPDESLVIDTWSRVDQAAVVELRNVSTGIPVSTLGKDDDSGLAKAGWQRPERFVAKGRDGTTDIHGVIYRPTRFDPNRKYPVIEDIYAGPHDFFVPKDFQPWPYFQSMAELGFIVVKIDGMGTNWRNKSFHDVCWKNLKDSGFPDRIPWIRAAAATRPWMDLSRMGICGGSAGGQSTLAGLLHHGDFYRVGVADCGCHDNRMDKIWWNEAWMGWPVDESYAENSNVTHAAKLTGKLMLVVGEIDQNVDPASTAQVVAALQKAGKEFDFVPVMNTGHGAAETPYGSFRRAGFLMKHLQADP